jgi:CRISPR-associated protein Csd2
VSTPIQHRYDFIYLFDVTDGNPNGDPDAGNLPRVDAETGQGLVTDVCLKRKVRNYVGLVHGEKPPYEIYIKEKAVLNDQHMKAYDTLKLKAEPKKLPKDDTKADELTRWMCQNFYDIRTFGAVMTTDVNAGQVRGPIQLTTSRSISPIVSMEHAITRCAVTNKKDEEKERTIGRKFAVPYGLYRGFGYINASLAGRTGFGDADLALFKKALAEMFEHDCSAARGMMRPVRCIAFRHEHRLGNARADQLFARVKVELKDELKADKRPPRSKDDYAVTVAGGDLPDGVTVEEWV